MLSQQAEIIEYEIDVPNKTHSYDEHQFSEYSYSLDDSQILIQDEEEKGRIDALLGDIPPANIQNNLSQNSCSDESQSDLNPPQCCPISLSNSSTSSDGNLTNVGVQDSVESTSDDSISRNCTEKDYPKDNRNKYGENEWSLVDEIPQYCIRNQSRESINIPKNGEDKIDLKNLKKKCSAVSSDKKYWFHATTCENAQNIIETGPRLGNQPSDYSATGAFYFNPSYVDCYDWFIVRNSSFKGSHAMLIYQFNPIELSENGEELDVKQWNKHVKRRSTTTCRDVLDWSLVPQNANPEDIRKKEKARHRKTNQGDTAMQLVIHTTDMCKQVRPCLVACVFYRQLSYNNLPNEYQYSVQDFLKKPSHSTREMLAIPESNNSHTLSNIQQQQNDDRDENNHMKKCRSKNSKKQKASEHNGKKNNRQLK